MDGKGRLPGETILEEIVRVRKNRLERLGPSEGAHVPAERTQPPQAFGTEPFLICEIKRRSPSKGNINNSLDPLEQAEIYLNRGASHISILTESAYFGGSLEDLMAVRKAYPRARILRKDFLLNRQDIDITHRAGADAFLLIASVLDSPTIKDLYEYGTSLGMTPLVELHSPEEAARVRSFAPKLTGVNCRDLKTFTIDPLGPLKLKPFIDWECQIVYESGIHSAIDARFALGCGFDGLLVGEGVVRNRELAAGLIREFDDREINKSTFTFWKKLYRNYNPSKPLVKICGITRKEDAIKAMELRADMLGFVLADSPRRIKADDLEAFRDLDVLKVGVIIMPEEPSKALAFSQLLKNLLDRGLLDGIQFHGKEPPDLVEKYPGYKALTIKEAADLALMKAYRPRPVLIDAFHRDRSGSKTETLDPELIEKVGKGGPLYRGNLWLAGGINPDNLETLLRDHKPDLIDMSSGVESAPGIKDHEKMARIFEIIDRYSGRKEE
jgi:indole-3-glycerol phosphate synthase/phosphoribosylanthranilate isomerase